MRKFILLLVLSLILTGCSQLPVNVGNPFNFGGSSEEGADLQGENIQFSGPQKGVVLNFRKGVPNDPINGRFSVILDVANYMDSFVSAELDVYDSTVLGGFESSFGVQRSLSSSIYDDNGLFFEPSIQSIEYPSTIYSGVRDGSQTQFFAAVEYLAHADAEVSFCLTDIYNSESSNKCPETQSLSGSSLGESNSRTPVGVTSVKKTQGWGDGSVALNLEIKISNGGGGNVSGEPDIGTSSGQLHNPYENIVEFNIIPQDGISGNFRCTSENSIDQSRSRDSSSTNLPMQIQLDKGKSAKIFCTNDIAVDSTMKNVRAQISLDYRYEYITKTKLIDVISGIPKELPKDVSNGGLA